MKEIIELELKKDDDVFDTILEFAEKKSWIYITGEIMQRMKETYKHQEYARNNGKIFKINKENHKFIIFVDENGYWNEIKLLYEEDKSFGNGKSYLASNPEIIVFLS